ncbi:MAG TPA: tetratricopeptide repeat protein [Pyrinomonadaceae bacterium]|jgi:tetratricopeptide (TPR) repeat protein|nr:tetratricopeptide repeat protein [Pyrinomonadaceae bacterium]
MLSRTSQKALVFASALALAFALLCARPVAAQDVDEFGDAAADPVKLFNQGQDAQSKKDYGRALELYEEALKLRPEFPEAEFQKASALVALKRLDEAEKSYRRAQQLKPEWALPPAALGQLLLLTPGREREAEPLLKRALELDPKNLRAAAALADLRERAADWPGSLEFRRRATTIKDADASLWLARARAERELKDAASALKSFERVLALEPDNAEARLGRSDILFESGQAARSDEDLRALEPAAKADAKLALAVASRHLSRGRADEARRVYDSLPDGAKNSSEGRALLAAFTPSCENTPETRERLEQLVGRDPENAPALACLGVIFRTEDPQRALGYFERAARLKPANADYATGYASALLQLRRFDEAATVLQRVVRAEPDNYAAHANFAAALYELKLYKPAIVEYKWVASARPELAVVHYFIGIAHDRLGEFEEALAAYETFLSRADAQTNGLEIEKVNLRLPTLRNQIKRGEGVKKNKRAQ